MNFRNKYVLAIDQGTTSSRAILFSHQGNIITLAQKTFQQYFPKPGWVEHDPNEIWYTQSSAIKEAMAKADVTDMHIACIGIANQRETTIIWDRETGFPVYNAIVWQDRLLRRIENKGVCLSDPAEDRIGDRCLFFCYEDTLDS